MPTQTYYEVIFAVMLGTFGLISTTAWGISLFRMLYPQMDTGYFSVAAHEAGHALVSYKLRVDLRFATIVPRGSTAGLVGLGACDGRNLSAIYAAGLAAEFFANPDLVSPPLAFKTDMEMIMYHSKGQERPNNVRELPVVVQPAVTGNNVAAEDIPYVANAFWEAYDILGENESAFWTLVRELLDKRELGRIRLGRILKNL